MQLLPTNWYPILWQHFYGSRFQNSTNFKILKEPLLVEKQTIPQQKALDLSFIWHPKSGRGIIMRLPRPPALKQLFLPHVHLCFSW